MCVILVCKSKKPSPEILKKCETANGHGIGIAYYTKDRSVAWSKGISMTKLISIVNRIPLPFVIHFRLDSVGDKSPSLCHPFPVFTDNDLSGICTKVLFHNGHMHGWEKMLLTASLIDSTVIDDLPWSDSRVMAHYVKKGGNNVCKLLGEKIALMTNDGIKVFGSGWSEEHGILFSNKTWNWGGTFYSRRSIEDYDDTVFMGSRGYKANAFSGFGVS